MLSPKCHLCRKPRHQHQAKTYACPMGPRKYRTYWQFSASNRFTPRPPKPRTKLASVSPKRKAQNAEYSKARKRYLAEHPACEAFCEASSTEIHHKIGRENDLLLKESEWMAVRRDCHNMIHQNPNMARSKGFLK